MQLATRNTTVVYKIMTQPGLISFYVQNKKKPAPLSSKTWMSMLLQEIQVLCLELPVSTRIIGQRTLYRRSDRGFCLQSTVHPPLFFSFSFEIFFFFFREQGRKISIRYVRQCNKIETLLIFIEIDFIAKLGIAKYQIAHATPSGPP